MEKTFTINGKEHKVSDYKADGSQVSFTLNGKAYSYNLLTKNGHELIIDNGSRIKAALSSPNREGDFTVIAGKREAIVSSSKKLKKAGAAQGSLTSPMPGKIFKIIKEVGSEVKKGEAILILEAMKMEHSIRSDKDGIVKKINYKVGELVQGGVGLAEVE